MQQSAEGSALFQKSLQLSSPQIWSLTHSSSLLQWPCLCKQGWLLEQNSQSVFVPRPLSLKNQVLHTTNSLDFHVLWKWSIDQVIKFLENTVTYHSCSFPSITVVIGVMRTRKESEFVSQTLHIVHWKCVVDSSKVRVSCALSTRVPHHPEYDTLTLESVLFVSTTFAWVLIVCRVFTPIKTLHSKPCMTHEWKLCIVQAV